MISDRTHLKSVLSLDLLAGPGGYGGKMMMPSQEGQEGGNTKTNFITHQQL